MKNILPPTLSLEKKMKNDNVARCADMLQRGVRKLAGTFGRDTLLDLTGEKLIKLALKGPMLGTSMSPREVAMILQTMESHSAELAYLLDETLKEMTLQTDKGCMDLALQGILEGIHESINDNGYKGHREIYAEGKSFVEGVLNYQKKTAKDDPTSSVTYQRIVTFMHKPETQVKLADFIDKYHAFLDSTGLYS